MAMVVGDVDYLQLHFGFPALSLSKRACRSVQSLDVGFPGKIQMVQNQSKSHGIFWRGSFPHLNHQDTPNKTWDYGLLPPQRVLGLVHWLVRYQGGELSHEP